MKAITWARDSHGLFDYESRHLTKSNLFATCDSILRRVTNEVELHPYMGLNTVLPEIRVSTQPGEAPTEPDVKVLLKLVNENGKATKYNLSRLVLYRECHGLL